jgi:WxL domain surface cell wall-binding
VTPQGGFAPGTHALTLPTGSLTLNTPLTVTSYKINQGDVGATTSKTPIALQTPTAIDNGSAVTVLDAPVGAGMGAYQLSFPTNNAFTLTVPASTVTVDPTNYPGTATPFSSTITWTVSSGP